MNNDQEIIYQLLDIGTPIEIDIPTDNGKMAEVYFSQVMDINEKTLTVSLPQRQGKLAARVTPGIDIYLRLSLDDAIYNCACEVKQWEKDPPALTLFLPHRVHRIQRRNYVRISAKLPITLTFKDENNPQAEPFIIETTTTDISGGGLLLTTEYQLPLYQECEVIISMEEIKPPEEEEINEEGQELQEEIEPEMVTALAQICRSQLKKDKRCIIGLSFVEITENMRDKIIRFIFKYQRESLKRRPHLTM